LNGNSILLTSVRVVLVLYVNTSKRET